MELASVSAESSELSSGFIDVAELPTGVTECIPVTIAEGEQRGPELWITATIHGDEINGLAVTHAVMDSLAPEGLAGTIVCVPNVNPAGLRRGSRNSYYSGDDPNRYFPAPDLEDSTPKRTQERINEKIFGLFSERADALIDLHTASIDAFPHNIRHRVLYGDLRTEAEARELGDEIGRLMDAFGFPIVNQFDDYLDKSLHRSMTGAAVNYSGIPAMTVELGGHRIFTDDVIDGGVAGCYRVMEALGMIPEVPSDIHNAAPEFRSPVEFSVKCTEKPHTDEHGIARYHVDHGEAVQDGELIAKIVSVHGNQKGTVVAPADGYFINQSRGAVVYEGDSIGKLVVRDTGDVVIPRSD